MSTTFTTNHVPPTTDWLRSNVTAPLVGVDREQNVIRGSLSWFSYKP